MHVRHWCCAAALALNATAALAQPELLWTELRTDSSGGLRKSPLNGGASPETIIDSGLRGAFRIAVDHAAGKVYWSSNAGDGIRRANLDGSGAETFLPISDPVLGLAFDPIGQRIVYYTDEHIVEARTDGTWVDEFIEDVNAVEDIAIDVAAGKLYLAQRGFSGDGVIWRANLDGTQLEPVISDIANGPVGLAVDPVHGALYWAQSGDGERGIRRATLAGDDIEPVIDDANVNALWIEPGMNQLVWSATDVDNDRIERADLDGQHRVVLHHNVGAGGLTIIPEPASFALLSVLTLGCARTFRRLTAPPRPRSV